MTVTISPNVQRTKQMIDFEGNTIDPKTKQILEYKEKEYVPTPEQLAKATGQSNVPVEGLLQPLQAPTAKQTVGSNAMSIQEQIEATEAKLAQLKDMKKQKIEEMKAELLKLESN